MLVSSIEQTSHNPCHCADGGGPIRVHGHSLLSRPHYHTEQGIELLDESEKYGCVGLFGNYRTGQWMEKTK